MSKNWISVSDRLPPLGKIVIVCGQKWHGKHLSHAMPGWRLDEWDRPRYRNALWAGMDGRTTSRPLKNVTHWMPMPAIPEATELA